MDKDNGPSKDLASDSQKGNIERQTAKIIAINELFKKLPEMGLYWLFAGGFLYTIGTVFFGLSRLWDRRGLFGFHEIFHVFVLIASFCHFWLMWGYIVYF